MSLPPTAVTSTTTTTTTAAPDKEAFQNYLENTGVLDTMTQLLVDLFENPNRPPDAIALFASKLGAIAEKSEDVKLLKSEIETLKAEKLQALHKIDELERTIAELRKHQHAAPHPK